ncbi:hypothetical protein BKA70DRAFT_1227114 [Coprinopsis sp. MPI-PUGE-AT-0042]|nr:hypothetical protein BKA70DRAFT_1227114 [Coprinopsis sp. MPI-PUGE-AT-0042]
MHTFSEAELEPAPLSVLSPEELREIGSACTPGAQCLLFPAMGDAAVRVNVPFHQGYASKRRPIDLDAHVLVDHLESKVYQLSDYMHRAEPFPPGSEYTLPNGYWLYLGPLRGTAAPTNRCLANYFVEPYRITGNVLVAQVSRDGQIVDIDNKKISLILHILIRIITILFDVDKVWLCTIALRLYYFDIPRSEEVSITYLARHLDFPSLVAMAGTALYHRDLFGREIGTRLQILMDVRSHSMRALCKFMAALDSARALLAGRVARNLVRDLIVPCRIVDILCPTQSVLQVEEALEAFGYTSSGLEAVVYPYMEDSVCDVRVFEGLGAMINLVRCPFDNAFPTLFHCSNTSMMNAISGTRIYSYYPRLTRAGVGLENKPDLAFRNFNPDIQILADNSRWMLPCDLVCPGTVRKTIDDSAMQPQASLPWGTNGWGLSSRARTQPSFVEPCWENNAGAISWIFWEKSKGVIVSRMRNVTFSSKTVTIEARNLRRHPHTRSSIELQAMPSFWLSPSVGNREYFTLTRMTNVRIRTANHEPGSPNFAPSGSDDLRVVATRLEWNRASGARGLLFAVQTNRVASMVLMDQAVTPFPSKTRCHHCALIQLPTKQSNYITAMPPRLISTGGYRRAPPADVNAAEQQVSVGNHGIGEDESSLHASTESSSSQASSESTDSRSLSESTDSWASSESSSTSSQEESLTIGTRMPGVYFTVKDHPMHKQFRHIMRESVQDRGLHPSDKWVYWGDVVQPEDTPASLGMREDPRGVPCIEVIIYQLGG